MSLYNMYHYDMADVTFYLLDMHISRRDHECGLYICLTGLSFILPYSEKTGYNCLVLLTCPAAKILQQVPGAS